MKIDAHQHFWRLGQNDCTWPTPDLSAIHRDFEPRHLAPLAAAAGVTGTVLVQSQPSDRDTDFLLDLAGRESLVQAVVGWVDMAAPDAPQRIATLAAHPKLRGLRPMLQNLPGDEWILDEALDPALAAMKTHGLSFDALIFPRHLPVLRRFAERHPWLAIVIDHGAKPRIANGDIGTWKRDILALAALPQVCCKLSGLVTEAEPDWRAQDLAPYVTHLAAAFGPDRLMWGSDWPVLELAGGYGEWVVLAERLTRGAVDSDALFAGTARKFYRLD